MKRRRHRRMVDWVGIGGGLLSWRSSPHVMWWLHQLGEQDRARIGAAGLQ